MNLLNTKANKPNEGQEYFSQFDNIYPYSEIGRWVVDRNTCQLLKALSHEDSNFTKMGQPIDLDTENEMIMVKYPAYYRKKNCRVNGVEQQGIALNIVPDKFGVNCPDGYVVEDWFIDENGTIAEYRMLGAFLSYENMSDGQMISIPNVIPTRSKNIQQFRDASKINRTDSGIMSFYAISAVQRLFILEFGDFDSQKVLGKGKTYLSKDNDVVASNYDILSTGETMALGNRSGYLNRTYNEEDLTDGKASISYRGLEDFFGNIWQFIDGLVVMDNGCYYTNSLTKMEQIKSDNVLNVDGWSFYETIVPTNNGYTSEMYGENLDFSFFSKEVNGSSSTYYSDYRYSYNGAGSVRVAMFGGIWYIGADAGAFYWALIFSAAAAGSVVGSRLEIR